MKEEKPAPQAETIQVQSFGMKLDELTPYWRERLGTAETNGVVVIGVEEGSIADEAGLEAGDIIKEVNRKPVLNLEQYNDFMDDAKGKMILLLVLRGKQTLFVSIPG